MNPYIFHVYIDMAHGWIDGYMAVLLARREKKFDIKYSETGDTPKIPEMSLKTLLLTDQTIMRYVSSESTLHFLLIFFTLLRLNSFERMTLRCEKVEWLK